MNIVAIGAIILAIVAITLFVWQIRAWCIYQRPLNQLAKETQPSSQPPESLNAYQITIIKRGQVDGPTIALATIVDLASRGYLKIDEYRTPKLHMREKQFIILKNYDGDSTVERDIMRILFNNADANRVVSFFSLYDHLYYSSLKIAKEPEVTEFSKLNFNEQPLPIIHQLKRLTTANVIATIAVIIGLILLGQINNDFATAIISASMVALPLIPIIMVIRSMTNATTAYSGRTIGHSRGDTVGRIFLLLLLFFCLFMGLTGLITLAPHIEYKLLALSLVAASIAVYYAVIRQFSLRRVNYTKSGLKLYKQVIAYQKCLQPKLDQLHRQLKQEDDRYTINHDTAIAYALGLCDDWPELDIEIVADYSD